RWRQVPSFCNMTIRPFHNNVSSLKKLAARDYEDLLQCALPVFEGLFENPVHDRFIQDLLFIMAEWHANAKLRMYTDSSLTCLQEATVSLGSKLRAFAKNICPLYDTRELPSEVSARGRRRRKKGQGASGAQTSSTAPAPKKKLLSLITYKLHALGDYVNHIITFGTTDSYSTQTVCSKSSNQ
ncbi:hypothetical protein K474DRAFT_1606851, partial [Panus rudis PR-1116 ss-1]